MVASAVAFFGFTAAASAAASSYSTRPAACAGIDPGTFVGACITKPNGSRTWLGSFKNASDGRVFICLDYLYSSRVGAHAVRSSAGLVNRNGVVVPDSSVRALSYAASRYAPTGSSGNPVTDAALAYVTRVVMGDGYVSNTPLRVGSALPDTSWGLPPVIYAKAKAIWAAARSHVGPYGVRIGGLGPRSQVGSTYQTTITVTSSAQASGGVHPMVGYPVTATVSGNLQLVSPTTGSAVTTDSAGQVTVTVKVSAPGTGTLTARADLPRVYASISVPRGWHAKAAPDTVPQRGLTATAGAGSTVVTATATTTAAAPPIPTPSPTPNPTPSPTPTPTPTPTPIPTPSPTPTPTPSPIPTATPTPTPTPTPAPTPQPTPQPIKPSKPSKPRKPLHWQVHRVQPVQRRVTAAHLAPRRHATPRLHAAPRIRPGLRIVPGTVLHPVHTGGVSEDPRLGLAGLAGVAGLVGLAAAGRRRRPAPAHTRAHAGTPAGPPGSVVRRVASVVKRKVPYLSRVTETVPRTYSYSYTKTHYATDVIKQRSTSYVPVTTYRSVPITTRIKTEVESFAKKVWGWITHPVRTVKTVWKTVTSWVLEPVTTFRKVTSWVTRTVHRVWHSVEHATKTVYDTVVHTVQRFKTVTEKTYDYVRATVPKVVRAAPRVAKTLARTAVTMVEATPKIATTVAKKAWHQAKKAVTGAATWLSREATRFRKDPLGYLNAVPGRLARGAKKAAKGLVRYGRDLVTSGPRLAKANIQATTAIAKLVRNRHDRKAQAQLADALLDALDAGLDLVDLVTWLLLLLPGVGEAAKLGITVAIRGLKQLGKKEARQELRNLIEKLLADTAETTKTRLAARDERGSVPLPGRRRRGIPRAKKPTERATKTVPEVLNFGSRAAAREGLPGDLAGVGNRFFRGATAKSQDFQAIGLPNGGYRLQFFSPANTPGYGKLYVQEIDRAGNILSRYKDTMGPNGFIERKMVQ